MTETECSENRTLRTKHWSKTHDIARVCGRLCNGEQFVLYITYCCGHRSMHRDMNEAHMCSSEGRDDKSIQIFYHKTWSSSTIILSTKESAALILYSIPFCHVVVSPLGLPRHLTPVICQASQNVLLWCCKPPSAVVDEFIYFCHI